VLDVSLTKTDSDIPVDSDKAFTNIECSFLNKSFDILALDKSEYIMSFTFNDDIANIELGVQYLIPFVPAASNKILSCIATPTHIVSIGDCNKFIAS